MLRFLRDLFQSDDQNIDRFQRLIELASSVHAERGRTALLDLAVAIGRPLQWQLITGAMQDRLLSKPDAMPRDLLFGEGVSLNAAGESLRDLARPVQGPREINLSTDLILPRPWEHSRLRSALETFPAPSNPWEHQPNQHVVEAWSPMPICWVTSGNHSIATGVIRKAGVLRVDKVTDISATYDHVKCDGSKFFRVHDGSEIGPVRDLAVAAIYEIGRMIAGSEG